MFYLFVQQWRKLNTVSVQILQVHIHKTAVYTECITNISFDV